MNSQNQRLKKASIIDDVIDDFQPKCVIVPYYGRKGRPVSLGNKFKPSKTKHKPSLRIYCPDMRETLGLTLVLTDPDAPERDNSKLSEYCHWIGIVIGLSSSDELGQYFDLDAVVDHDWVENEVVEYQAPNPPPKTGYHRYVFVLLEGDTSNLTAPSDRKHWGMGKGGRGVREWAKQEGLAVIGANWFIEKNKKQ
ncbi:PEBP-like protein [Venustampulla echinocandica]|uniref:PEBP-like protein n=1 Tax=Venustampulla echinocandica TaxID=2656787 RepID=A0A370TSD7_9HELO|nr:PEBP-like protein [Venustampulla echinocandica]RDL38445.1 PEBP-like protein [Venustampulla echinocandica]